MKRFNKFPWENIFLIHLKIVSHLLLFPVWPWNTFSFLSEKTNHRNGDSYKSPFRRFLMDITNMFWAFWLFSALLKEGFKIERNRNFNIQVKITAGSLWKASKRKMKVHFNFFLGTFPCWCWWTWWCCWSSSTWTRPQISSWWVQCHPLPSVHLESSDYISLHYIALHVWIMIKFWK